MPTVTFHSKFVYTILRYRYRYMRARSNTPTSKLKYCGLNQNELTAAAAIVEMAPLFNIDRPLIG